MKTFTAGQLQEILRRHSLWLRNNEGGTRANLAGANLADANLAGADLTGANLTGANLAGAHNVPVQSDAPIAPYTRPTNDAEREARRVERMTAYRARHPQVPVVEDLDSRTLAAIEGDGAVGALDMGAWHTCGTTHCLGGWAVHHAGEAGYALERQIGVERAAAAIYRASTGRVPHFFAPHRRALEDLRKRAAEERERKVSCG